MKIATGYANESGRHDGTSLGNDGFVQGSSEQAKLTISRFIRSWYEGD